MLCQTYYAFYICYFMICLLQYSYQGGIAMTNEEIKKWLYENLLTKEQSRQITNQSAGAFNQSVNLGRIKPFFETNGNGVQKVRLYLKKDIEDYAKNKRKI